MDTKLTEIISETLHIPREKVTDDLSMAEVESWDSLQHMNLVASLEQSFGIELTFEEIVLMKNVGEIRRILKGRGAAV